jgi:site-specific DNA recombinase
MIKKCVGYCRVSSREQANNSHALVQQQERVRLAGVEEILTDVDSGSKDNRLNWKKLQVMVEAGEIGQIICTRVDRLTRSLPALRNFIDLCNIHKVTLVALDDNIDGSTAAGKFHINMLGSLAEMETDRLSERCKHGHDFHRSRQAAYFAPFGYVKDGDKLRLDHALSLCLLTGEEFSRAAVGRDLVEIFLQTLSLRKALRIFNEKYGIQHFSTRGKGNSSARGKLGFGVSGLTSWLNNPILRGHLAYGRTGAQRQSHSQNWQLVLNTHESDRLISDTEYLQIERILNHNAAVGGYGFKSDKIHPLSGLVYCGECRGRCRVTNYRLRTDKLIRIYSYQCNNYHFKSCSQKKSVRVDVIEPMLISALVERSQQIFNELNTDTVEIIPGVDSLNEQLRQLSLIPQSAIINKAIEDIKKEITQLKIQHNLKSAILYQEKTELAEIFADPVFWDTYLKLRLTPLELRSIYRRFCDRVYIRGGRVESVNLLI